MAVNLSLWNTPGPRMRHLLRRYFFEETYAGENDLFPFKGTDFFLDEY